MEVAEAMIIYEPLLKAEHLIEESFSNFNEKSAMFLMPDYSTISPPESKENKLDLIEVEIPKQHDQVEQILSPLSQKESAKLPSGN